MKKESEKKIIKTFVGDIHDDEEKVNVFGEIQLIEDRRYIEAQRAFFRRLNEDDRTEAWRWTQYYKELVGDERNE